MDFSVTRGIAAHPRHRDVGSGGTPTNRRLTRVGAFLLAAASVAGLAAVACGDGDSEDQEQVSIDVTANGLEGVPSRVRTGFVRFTFDVEAGEASHSIVFLRANDGVSAAELVTAAEQEEGPDFDTATPVGGSTTIEPGGSATLILQLQPGLYSVSHAPEGSLANTRTFEVSGEPEGKSPSVKGVIEMGPGLTFKLPGTFDGDGVFEVANRDDDMHEAGFIRLGQGTTTAMLIDWVNGGFEGPPPDFAFAGGFGPVNGGGRGWVEANLERGSYAVICFIFDEAGPHFANGMLAEFTVE